MIGKFKQREYSKAINQEVNVSKRKLPDCPEMKDA
jgi:hypothetical protein